MISIKKYLEARSREVLDTIRYRREELKEAEREIAVLNDLLKEVKKK
jgi:hypothetical protein